MTIPGILLFKKHLVQGRVYSFRIHNKAVLQDNEEYYILEDPFKVRHFIPAKYYIRYNFAVDQIIQCRVDKINCTGRVLLEPVHPYYEKGRAYDFVIREVDRGFDGRTSVIISDVLDNLITIQLKGDANDILKAGTVRLKIVNIKKGIPVFK
jgi:hypothetical protein